METFKRILRETSDRLLSKLGATRSSHQLVLNNPLPDQGIYQSSKCHLRKVKRNKKSNNLEPISQALLLAAKNQLPPVQFHHVHGPHAQLSKNKFVAKRTQSFCQALVFSNRVILPNERVYIKVLDIAKGWSGTIRFGFTSVDPATLRYQMPKHVCPDMTNAGHTWARALADELVRRNSVIHFSYSTNGYIHYGINNQDCGVFHANVKTSQHLWFIIDVYGLTSAIELIDPRVHNAFVGEDFNAVDDDLRTSNQDRSPNKTFGTLDDIATHHVSSRVKRKRTRKSRQDTNDMPFYSIRPSESSFLSPSRSSQGPVLSNLDPIIIPTAQQNIYSPMPTSSSKNKPVNCSPAKPKTRHSIRSSPKTARDQNNNSPPSKDCPICFERPINCVLYQCGHMCTCYECGVKQWRTQSRTCPICRTVIKDVIKTYMS